MSRGVYVPRDAELVVYFHDTLYNFDIFLDKLKEYFHSKMPSLYEIEAWVGREGYIFMENSLVKIGISEYAGIIAVWVLINEENKNLAYNWLSEVEKHFYNLPVKNKLKLVGYFSSGAPIFRRVK